MVLYWLALLGLYLLLVMIALRVRRLAAAQEAIIRSLRPLGSIPHLPPQELARLCESVHLLQLEVQRLRRDLFTSRPPSPSTSPRPPSSSSQSEKSDTAVEQRPRWE